MKAAVLVAVAIVAAALVILLAILAARWIHSTLWRDRLVTYRLRLPAGLRAGDVSKWLGVLAADTHRWPVSFELVADETGISHYLLVPLSHAESTLSRLRSTLPGIRADEAPDYLDATPAIRGAAEFRLTTLDRPLAHDRAESSTTALLASLYPLSRGETVHVQCILSGTRALSPSPEAPSELARAVRAKNAAAMFSAVARVAVNADSRKQTNALLTRVSSAFRTLNSAGVSVQRRLLSSSAVAGRFTDRSLPLTVWPMRLNTDELAGLLGIPLGDVHLPGIELGRARQLPPPGDMPRHGLTLAISNFPGAADRPLVLQTEDRLRHLHLIGPTGVGKSTLIANLALQDVERGDGVMLVDPKSALVSDVLARVPQNRTEDVIVLDPSATDYPVGFNVLQVGRSEHERELVVDHVVHVFSELWRSSWGPRTSDVLRTCLLTLTHTTANDGSAFTLCEVPELLLNPAFRRFVTAQASVPDTVRSFWSAYESMSDGERTQVIGPSLNKLRSLTTRTPLRLMLGQSRGIDLADLYRQRRVILVPLSKGTVGTETAHLLGSLLMAALWQTTLARAARPAAHRRPAWAYLDEFQDVLRLGTDAELADMLAQSRGLGLGLTLAHQYLDQLPRAVQSAVLGTVRSQLAFQLDFDDARTLERRFAPALAAADLMGLPAYEIALRPSVHSQTRPPTTGTTLPLPDSLRDPDALAMESRQRFGTPRTEVETALKMRLETPTATPIGRKRRGGSA
ncbi:type IV secretory system conjugative DNA transfer family protein [Amycolatopsis sp. NPDC049688]|uniref:type IV secretory system conjugative DNA transfer family protein n=1 Tax=Amycolatopsis sp. NPDC049688 TaxID=3154733 RepID=UPI003424A20E